MLELKGPFLWGPGSAVGRALDLGFGSDHDLRLVRWRPVLGSVLTGGWFLCPFLCASPPRPLSLLNKYIFQKINKVSFPQVLWPKLTCE